MKITLNGTQSFIVVFFCIISFASPTAKSKLDSTSNTLLFVAVTSQGSESVSTDAPASTSTLTTQEIHSSFSEDVGVKPDVFSPPSKLTEAGSAPGISNVAVAQGLGDSVDGIVFTLADTASAELQHRVATQPNVPETHGEANATREDEEAYVVRAEPRQPSTEDEQPTTKDEPVRPSQNETRQEPARAHSPEEIPSFSEWSQKHLAEAERKKGDENATDRVIKSSTKIRNKNYGSPDCGAKIVAANPESVSPFSILSPSKDEYMLNYCTSRIWFVVELCEAIQAKQLDLANFELFSSSPKDFTVSISSRYPTREWNSVGKFTAADSRDIQTFDLNPHLFGKFLKLELHSHYGKEHFCPMSWVRVYGTSEYEVLAKEDERHTLPDDDDDDEEELTTGQKRDPPKNLFSSATDAVLSIVKKATAPFIRNSANGTEVGHVAGYHPSGTETCCTPRFITVCDKCSQHVYDSTFYLISCRHATLSRLVASSFVENVLLESDLCVKFGFDFVSLRREAMYPGGRGAATREHYLTAFLSEPYLAALCNSLAVLRNRVVVNTSVDHSQPLKNLTDEPCPDPHLDLQPQPSQSCSTDCTHVDRQPSVSNTRDYSTTSHLLDLFKHSQRFTEKIKPTRTLKADEVKDISSVVDSEALPTIVPSVGKVVPTASVTLEVEETKYVDSSSKNEDASTYKVTFIEKMAEEAAEPQVPEGPALDPTLDAILEDLTELEQVVNLNSASSTTIPPLSNLPKESIFLRLANRIKNLEVNMSLSSSYLEEMSRRYRQQLETLAKTVNLTAQRVEEQHRVQEERERRREEELSQIRSQLANLTRDVGSLLREKHSWRPGASMISQHVVLVSVEMCIVWLVLSLWRREEKQPDVPMPRRGTKKVKRRSSLEGVTGHASPAKKMARRPSDEALAVEIAGSYCDNRLKIKKKRKKKENGNLVKRKRSEASNESGGTGEMEERTSINVPKEEVERVQVLLPAVDLVTTNRFDPISCPAETGRRFSSPVFMRTAISSRSTRLMPCHVSQPSDRESSQESSTSTVSAPGLLAQPQSDQSEQRHKETKKAIGGLKKYMKKFF